MPRKKRSTARGNAGANKKLYNNAKWRSLSKRVRMRDTLANDGIGCCICAVSNGTGNADHCDHIIPVSEGGAPHDERNLWGICVFHHNVKSGYERHGLRVGTVSTYNGLIPANRNEVVSLILNGREGDV